VMIQTQFAHTRRVHKGPERCPDARRSVDPRGGR
jgi:hypothetical protein